MGNLIVLWLQGAGQLLLVGLLVGAGLPLVFALGIRALAWAEGGAAEKSRAEPRPVGRLLAWLCFGVVVLGVLLGLAIIVASGFGLELVFRGGVPVFVKED
ncbi:hypothetical protein [Ornithinimicrobium tianjinense]|uniref:Transmembrane protein n=1 Tax=Ornithinimicrobium tianjinense TaxID=1195761 RepID=A0A917F8J6_9MICO|nr:hypothetical protein [Ornithinimicrobium tianjinense]GGF56691.1 hypothetical protein GCM10011366_25700 [Ornithinimicrobium tianjinense]